MEVIKARPPEVDEILLEVSGRFGITKKREGIHCTDCIYCPRKAFWDKVDPLSPSPKEVGYFLTGLALQEALLGGKAVPVTEVDGIKLSPDWYGEGVLAELKTTMIGQKRLDAYDFPQGWIKQLKAYCYALKLYKALLIVIPLLTREPLSYVLVFTDEELVENWEWVKFRATILNTAFSTNTLPMEKGEVWECRNCRYNLRCLTIEAQGRGN